MGIEKWVPKRMRSATEWPDFDFESFFGDLFRTSSWPSQLSRRADAWAPDVDISERQDEVVVRADLPGLRREDLQVTVTDDALTLRGERRSEETVDEEDFYRTERWSGSFTRTLPLPAPVSTSEVKATFKDGVLEVHLPRSGEANRTRVEIES